jgi:hypothetical protein
MGKRSASDRRLHSSVVNVRTRRAVHALGCGQAGCPHGEQAPATQYLAGRGPGGVASRLDTV